MTEEKNKLKTKNNEDGWNDNSLKVRVVCKDHYISENDSENFKE